MNYEQKYLKYKSKYLALKTELDNNLFGSAINPLFDSKLDESQKLQYKIKELQRIIIQSEEGIKNNKLSISELVDKIQKTKEEINELEKKLNNLPKNNKTIPTSSQPELNDSDKKKKALEKINRNISVLESSIAGNTRNLKNLEDKKITVMEKLKNAPKAELDEAIKMWDSDINDVKKQIAIKTRELEIQKKSLEKANSK